MKKYFSKLKKVLHILFTTKQKGMSALLIVIIIGASSFLIAQSVVFLSIGELEMSQVVNRSNNALYLSEACVSEALFQLKLDEFFLTTNKELLFDGDDSCFMTVSADGDNRTIFSVGVDGDYRKSIEVGITVSSGNVILDSYRVYMD